MQEISKIPSIFGRKNDVSKRLDRESDLKIRNTRGEDVEMMMLPRDDSSNLEHSNVKVRVHSKGDSYEQKGKNGGESEEVRAKPKE